MNAYPGYHTQSFKTPEERGAAASRPTVERQEMIKTILFPYKQFTDVTKEVTEFHIPVEETQIVGTARLAGR